MMDFSLSKLIASKYCDSTGAQFTVAVVSRISVASLSPKLILISFMHRQLKSFGYIPTDTAELRVIPALTLTPKHVAAPTMLF
jgi:hypothetical protein